MMAAATGVAFTLFGTVVTGAVDIGAVGVVGVVVAAAGAGAGFATSPAGLVAVSLISAKIAPIKMLSPSFAL